MTPVRAPAEFWNEAPEAEALLESWLVSEGDTVEAGQVLAQVVVVKTTLDLLAPGTGSVARLLVPEGATFRQDEELAELEDG